MRDELAAFLLTPLRWYEAGLLVFSVLGVAVLVGLWLYLVPALHAAGSVA